MGVVLGGMGDMGVLLGGMGDFGVFGVNGL